MNQPKNRPNRGFLYERTQFNLMEWAFADTWEHYAENVESNLLEDIIGDSAPTNRDRYVAASLLQWLGTNVGYSFMARALEKCGHYIAGKESHANDPLVRAVAQAHLNQDAAQFTFDLSEPS